MVSGTVSAELEQFVRSIDEITREEGWVISVSFLSEAHDGKSIDVAVGDAPVVAEERNMDKRPEVFLVARAASDPHILNVTQRVLSVIGGSWRCAESGVSLSRLEGSARSGATARRFGEIGDVAEGADGSAQVLDAFYSYEPHFNRLYRDAVKRRPELQGELRLRLEITPEGQARSVELIGSTLDDSYFEQRVRLKVHVMEFGELPASGWKGEYILRFVSSTGAISGSGACSAGCRAR